MISTYSPASLSLMDSACCRPEMLFITTACLLCDFSPMSTSLHASASPLLSASSAAACWLEWE